jgi:hypothetical protein
MKRNQETGVLVREDSITSYNLQDLKVKHPKQIKIRDFTPHEEARISGADWEWWFVDNDGAIGFAVQAKRLDKGAYDVAYTPDNHPPQIETLLKYCQHAADISPLYCWYNYFPWDEVENDVWGCAIADGYSVYGKHLFETCSIEDIQPISAPWHHLVCNFNRYGSYWIRDMTRGLSQQASSLAPLALPAPIVRRVPEVHPGGLPNRVIDLLKSKGVGAKPKQLRDPPVSYPGRLVIIERQWPRSNRFD